MFSRKRKKNILLAFSHHSSLIVWLLSFGHVINKQFYYFTGRSPRTASKKTCGENRELLCGRLLCDVWPTCPCKLEKWRSKRVNGLDLLVITYHSSSAPRYFSKLLHRGIYLDWNKHFCVFSVSRALSAALYACNLIARADPMNFYSYDGYSAACEVTVLFISDSWVFTNGYLVYLVSFSYPFVLMKTCSVPFEISRIYLIHAIAFLIQSIARNLTNLSPHCWISGPPIHSWKAFRFPSRGFVIGVCWERKPTA